MAGETITERLEAEEQADKQRLRKKLIIAGIVILVLLVGGWFLLGTLWNYTAQSQMERRIDKAHTFANVIHEWKGRDKEIESGIWQIGASDEAFDKFLVYYFSDDSRDWFGLALDADGEIRYTLYSEQEIPEEYLQDPPDYDEQNKLLRSHFFFRKKKTVAVWTPADDWMPGEREG